MLVTVEVCLTPEAHKPVILSTCTLIGVEVLTLHAIEGLNRYHVSLRCHTDSVAQPSDIGTLRGHVGDVRCVTFMGGLLAEYVTLSNRIIHLTEISKFWE
jgi:hypothetical protein